MKRVLIVTDVHYCPQQEYGGITRDEKLEILLKQINDEYLKEPFEFILFLGDYSLDHWQWLTKGTWLTSGKSYTAEFVKKLCALLPTPYYMLPGNHEQYGKEKWKEITGFSRNMEVITDDYLFILWDSFGADLDPTEHTDGTYTKIDVKRVRELMDKHPDKKVILCSHWFSPADTKEEKELLCDPRIICLFVGHSHRSDVIELSEEYGKKKVIQCGSWAAVSPEDDEHLWGVRDVCLFSDKLITRYLVAENELSQNGEKYTVLAHYRDGTEIRFENFS